MKIAQALLLRKQLERKVAQLEPIKLQGEDGLLQTKVRRVNVTAEIDEVSIQVPKITLGDVTAEYDKYASALRKLDASIQKANWEFDVDFADSQNPFE
jgi:hypothetical protein